MSRRTDSHLRLVLAVLIASTWPLAATPGCKARYAACDPLSHLCPGGSSSDGSNDGDLGGTSSGGADSSNGGLGGAPLNDGQAGADLGGASGGTSPAQDAPIAVLGTPCTNSGDLACSSHASRLPLLCENGVWTSAGQCSLTERCATSDDWMGTCQEAMPECIGKAPGDWVCRNKTRFRCGIDLLDPDEPEVCADICHEGTCKTCVPSTAATCWNNQLETCSESGEWVRTPCPAEAPHCSEGVCGSPPSCIGLAKTCRAGSSSGVASEHCCDSLLVEGGAFDIDNDPARPAQVSDFRLDRHEVTVARFRKFKAAWDAGWTPSEGSGKHSHLHDGLGLIDALQQSGFESGWDSTWAGYVDMSDAARTGNSNVYATWTPVGGSGDSRPINFVNLYEAMAFCIWDGGFLPSGPESSFASSGGSDQRLYPWGDAVPGTNTALAVYGCFLLAGTCSSASNLATVGLAGGVGKFGQLDLAGNVAERTLGNSTTTGFCQDCVLQSVIDGSAHRARGGAFDSSAEELLTTQSIVAGLASRSADVGFRCARPP